MNACVIIPARYASSRFPGKPLVPLLGKPMILWVAELSARAVGDRHVYVATEDERIRNTVEQAGFRAIMTSSEALTGTDRLAEAAQDLPYDIIVNVQGDEPLVNPVDIGRCIGEKYRTPDQIINGFTWIESTEDPSSVNIPKLVTDERGTLLYMSRSLVPGSKDSSHAPKQYKKQVCIYAFSKEELAAYGAFGRKSELEVFEDIEILRFFELGLSVRMYETHPGSLAVDVPEDVVRVEATMRDRGLL